MIFVQLYEQILAENEKLKAQLRDTDLELADLKLQLEKATQVSLHYLLKKKLFAIIFFSYMRHLLCFCRGRNVTLIDHSLRWRKG